jgi:hypothetical protein
MAAVVDLEQFALTLVGISFQLLDTPELWQWFGYPKRPTRGAIFTRFVPAERLNREHFLKREVVTLCTERQFRWLHHHVDHETVVPILARSLELLTGGPGPKDHWWKILGFPSKSAARQYFVEGLATYLTQRDVQGLGSTLIKRLVPVVDEARLGLWSVGAAHLSTSAISPLVIIPTWLADSFRNAQFTGAVRLRDTTLSTAAQGLLALLSKPVLPE